jgi:hypothetical protein
LKSRCTDTFWKLFDCLHSDAQKQADAAYAHFKNNPYHPSLDFKCVNRQNQIYSVRIGMHYRALGEKGGDTILWFWIGSHEKYNRLLSEL